MQVEPAAVNELLALRANALASCELAAAGRAPADSRADELAPRLAEGERSGLPSSVGSRAAVEHDMSSSRAPLGRPAGPHDPLDAMLPAACWALALV